MSGRENPVDLFSADGLELLDLLLEEQGIDTAAGETIGRREDPSELPLSFAQQRLWFLDQWRPGSPSYNISSAYLLTGAWDLSVLARSLAEVVRRHEVLRCTIPTGADGRPVQVLSPAGPFPLPVVDLGGLPPEARRSEAERRIAAEARGPFDLAAGPLLRAAVLRLGPDEQALVVNQHHIVSDGWSMGVLVREVAALYAAFAAGRPSPLPELPIQYADFAAWQRRHLQGELLERQLGWWRERLRGAPALLELPTDRPRPPVQGYAGATASFSLPGRLRDTLDALAQREGATLYMVLLAAFDTLLHRVTGSYDLVVGSPVANRNRDEVEGLIGFFVNTLALRADLSGDPTFRELLGRVREVTLGAYDHQDVPFEMLVDELGLEREPSHTPLFQVVFTLQNAPVPAVGLPGGASLRPLPAHSGTAKFDLSLAMTEGPEGIAASIEYGTDLFDEATVLRLAGRLRILLEGIAEDPDRRLSELPLLTLEEREEIAAWGTARGSWPAAGSLHGRFAAQAAKTPRALAVTAPGGESLTYAELSARAGRLAGRLHALGVGPESRVGLLAERSPALVVGILGILEAGGAYLPLDPAHPDERLLYMLRDAGAALVVADPALAGRAAALVEGEARTVPLDAGDGPAPDTPPPVRVEPEHPAYVIYTSGSTGRPKGVVVTHANALRLFDATHGWFGFGPEDVWTLFHSYAFDFSVWEIWGALLYGGRLVVVPYLVSRSPEDFHRLLREEGVTVLSQTPSAFRQLVHVDQGDDPAANGALALRWVVFGGEALDLPGLAPWFERHGDRRPRLVNMYGITETTVHVTWREIDRADVESPGSVLGRAIPDLSLHLVGLHGEPVPVGVPGEIHVGGAGLARGYLGRPGLTAERFVPNPFAPGDGTGPGSRLYRSGDLARWLPGGDLEGDLEYWGRIDHQVKVRGFRIELGEIEAALAGHPAVRDAAVLQGEDGRLAGFVVPREGQALRPAELRAHLEARLPDYMVPAGFAVLDALPLTANGKLDRRALLRHAPAAGAADEGEHAAPRTPAEELLAAVWQQVLGLERVGIHDNFFAHGGDSIRSIQVISLARERGLKLSVQDLFQHQTIAALAAALAEVREGAETGAQGEPLWTLPEEDRACLPEDVEDAYPLTGLQAGMLFHMALAPEEALYHNVNSWHLQGPFDLAALQEAVDRAVARHAVLRTSFDLGGTSEPLQRVHRGAELPVGCEDLRLLDPERQEAVVDEYVRRERGRPFDLSRPPQVRFQVHRRSDDSFQFTLTENHAIFDGWSLHSTLTEIFRHYSALLRGEPLPSEPPPAASFRDFVMLERAASRSEETRTFWSRKLADAPFGGLPRWPVERNGSGSVSRLLPPEMVSGLKALAREAAVPLKSVLLAVHARVMAAAGGEGSVVTGFVVNGRPESRDGEEVRGLFLNTVPLRLEPGEARSWRELVRAAFEAEWEMLAHRRHPLASIQADAAGGRPLFETGFNYIHFHVAEAIGRTGGLAVLGGKRSEGNNLTLMVNFDQTLTGAGGIVLGMDYNAAELARPQVEAIAGMFLQAFAAMLGDPDADPSAASLLPREEHQLLAAWNDTARDYGPEVWIHELFAARAAAEPEAVALVFEGEPVSYGELRRRAVRLARRLRALGVGPDVPVGVCAERSPELVTALLAVLESGGAYLPLDPEYPRERLAFMIGDARAPVLLAQERLLDRLPDHGARMVLLDAGLDAGAEPAKEEGGEGEQEGPRPTGGCSAYVIYTSGSTGRPKGVVVPHRGIRNRLLWMQEAYRLTPEDRVLQKTPFSFDVSVWEFFWPLLAGARLVVARPGGHRDSAYLAGLIAEQGVTVVHFVPSMLRAFVEEPAAGRCSSLRLVVCSGEALAPDLRDRLLDLLPGVELQNLYGPTEASVDVTAWACRRGDASPVVPIGRPIANTAVHVVDRGFQPAPLGVPGELCLGGVQLARGYLARPDLTAERFVPDPFGAAGPPPDTSGGRLYRTGDLARWLPDGTVEFLGRLDHQVKVRGFRIELGEIEAALLDHPAVREAVVVDRREGGDTRLAAYLVPAGELRLPELREHLASRLPDYMVPSWLTVLEALPLTASGKLDRKALPAPEGTALRATEHVPPRDAVESALASIWGRLLGVERVSVHDSFFDLGGHSLLAHRVLAAVRESFGVEVPLRALFEKPTVAELAAAVAQARSAAVDGEAAAARIERLPRRPGEPNRFPASFAQLREWILDRLEPGSPAYNIPSATRAAGPLSAPVLAAAVREIVRRHESLRTTFEATDGEPVQVVAPEIDLPVPLLDLSALPEAVREAESRRLAQATSHEPFDLARGPLLRVRLVRLAEREHLILSTVHHIVSDGWSTGIFSRELAALYAAFAVGEPSPLPDLPVQYGDFAAWQRERLQGEGLERELGYWRDRLAGLPPLLALPTDRPRPPVQTFRGARQPFRLSREEVAGLRALASGEGTTLFVVVLAAYQTVLGRWSGQEDFAVGTFSGSRRRAELEGLIGFFINTLALRAALGGEPTFRGLVRRLREVSLEAHEHGEVPFERVLDALRLERDLSRTPLFQTMLILQSFPAAAIQPSEVSLLPLAVEDDRSNFDLSLWLVEGDGDLAGSLEHNTDLFEPATIRRLGEHLRHLVRAALADPDRPVAELEMAGEAERHQVLVEWSSGEPVPEAPSIPELFAARVRQDSGAVALVAEAGEVTYGGLAARARELAGRLRAAGAGPERLVAVCLERSFDLIASLLAVLETGAAYLPLDPEYPAERLGLMLEDSGAAVLVTRETFLATLPSIGPRRVLLDENPVSDVGEGGRGSVRPAQATGSAAGAHTKEPSTGERTLAEGGYGSDWGDHPAYVIYTSGSTGRPKGVAVRHGSLARYTETARRAYGIAPGDRVLQFASIGFDTSAEEIWPCLAAGATLVLRTDPRPEEAPEFLAGLARLGVTVLDLPTAYWHELVAALERDPRLAFPECVRLVILGGERALPPRVRSWRERVGKGTRLVNTYGPTEGTIVATHALLSPAAWDSRWDAEVPIGRPVPGARTLLLDCALRPVPLGAWGELCIGGAGLARGYLGRPDLTAERFVPSPFGEEPGARQVDLNGAPGARQIDLDGAPGERLYRTGDLARFRRDGQLEFGGRVDLQVKVRGVRVEPGEVEAALTAHPALAEAAVAARPDPAGGWRLVAWVVPRVDPSSGQEPTVTDLRAFLRERLPEAMIPSAFAIVPALPRLPNGKVDRRSLPDPAGDRPRLGTAYVAPETGLERTIAEVWRDLLRVEEVGLHDNFFDLGGHSLLLVQAQGRLREALGRDIPVVDLFRFPTVSLLARHLGQEHTAAAAARKVQDLGGKQRAAQDRQRQAMAKALQARMKKPSDRGNR